MKTEVVRIFDKKKKKTFTVNAVDYANSSMMASDRFTIVTGELHDGSKLELVSDNSNQKQEIANEAPEGQEEAPIPDGEKEETREGVTATDNNEQQPVKRGRGRPRKNPQ